eukprot:Hpha_TRINITY_DN28247_c0_g1::TRINITY_DN28247_c0_g1_i1::g.116769::m.116769
MRLTKRLLKKYHKRTLPFPRPTIRERAEQADQLWDRPEGDKEAGSSEAGGSEVVENPAALWLGEEAGPGGREHDTSSCTIAGCETPRKFPSLYCAQHLVLLSGLRSAKPPTAEPRDFRKTPPKVVGDWVCGGCGHLNFSYRRTCVECRVKRHYSRKG